MRIKLKEIGNKNESLRKRILSTNHSNICHSCTIHKSIGWSNACTLNEIYPFVFCPENVHSVVPLHVRIIVYTSKKYSWILLQIKLRLSFFSIFAFNNNVSRICVLHLYFAKYSQNKEQNLLIYIYIKISKWIK